MGHCYVSIVTSFAGSTLAPKPHALFVVRLSNWVSSSLGAMVNSSRLAWPAVSCVVISTGRISIALVGGCTREVSKAEYRIKQFVFRAFTQAKDKVC